MTSLPPPARQLGHDDRVGRRRAVALLGWPGLVGLGERDSIASRALRRGGAIDQLFDRRLKLGDPAASAVLID